MVASSKIAPARVSPGLALEESVQQAIDSASVWISDGEPAGVVLLGHDLGNVRSGSVRIEQDYQIIH